MYGSLNIHTITAHTQNRISLLLQKSNIFIDISISREYPRPASPKVLEYNLLLPEYYLCVDPSLCSAM